MRSARFLATIAGALAISSFAAPAAAPAADGLIRALAADGGACGCDSCGGGGHCDGGCSSGCKHRGLFGHGHGHRRMEGTDKAFNCGCNGSYKFPVPPLYTYHWPGLYSHQLMTDYHSPWRFPPIKPYVDEAIIIDSAASTDGALSPSSLRPVSHSTEIDGRAEPSSTGGSMSSLMQRIYR